MHTQNSTKLTGSVKQVFVLSWPLIIGMLSFTIMDVTDTLMVGQLGKSELAGVGIATTVIFFINSFFLGFFESVKILVAQATGAGQKDTAQKAAWQGIYLAIPCSLLIFLISFFSRQIFDIFGGAIHLREISNEYFVVRIQASFFWFITLAINGYFQGIGNTKLPMRINVMMCLLNILFGRILIFGYGPIPAMGVVGSAYATIISDGIAVLVVLFIFLRTTHIKMAWMSDLAKKLFRLGLPMGTRWLLDTGGWTLVVAMIANLGEDQTAANQVATRIMCLSILPVYGLSEAAAIMAGQCVGAKNNKALNRSYWSTMKLALIIMGTFGFIFTAFPEHLVSLFQTDPEVIAIGSSLLLYIGAFQLLVAFSMTTAGTLNGTGDTKYTMIVSVSISWLFMIPLAYLLGYVWGYGMFGMWTALIIQEVLLILAYQWRYHSGSWKGHQVV